MQINYFILIPVLVAVVILVILFVRRNQKDKKQFEQEVNTSEVSPEKHDDDKT